MADQDHTDIEKSWSHRRLSAVVENRLASMAAVERAEFDRAYEAETARIDRDERADARRDG